jgi:hypothetical protein
MVRCRHGRNDIRCDAQRLGTAGTIFALSQIPLKLAPRKVAEVKASFAGVQMVRVSSLREMGYGRMRGHLIVLSVAMALSAAIPGRACFCLERS